MYRFIEPLSEQQLQFRMLFQPATDGVFYRACEADGYRGLVAAILNDADYEDATVADRLKSRIRMAEDVVLVYELRQLNLRITDRDAVNAINVHADPEFIKSLERIGFLSLSSRGVSEGADKLREELSQ